MQWRGGGAEIHAAGLVQGVGTYSLSASDIICLTANCTYDLNGHYAGYGATFTCPATVPSCVVNCYGSGCAGLYVHEEVGASLTVNLFGNIAPIYNQTDLGCVPNETWWTPPDFDCNSANALTFDDSEEYLGIVVDVAANEGPACFRGQEACVECEITSLNELPVAFRATKAASTRICCRPRAGAVPRQTGVPQS